MTGRGLPVLVALALVPVLLGLVASLDRWAGVRALRRWSVPPEGSSDRRRGRGWGGHPRRAGVGTAGSHGGPGRVPDRGARLALVVSEVAVRLRAGAPTAHAWRETWARAPGLPPLGDTDDEGVPDGVRALADHARWNTVFVGGPTGLLRRLREVARAAGPRSRPTRAAARAVVAACCFTHHLGAPLAQVLERVADGIDESGAAEDARRIAGQGPRTSTRVLTGLPLLGIVGGELLGASPLERFTDGGVGSLCLAVGVACLLAGHLVARSMVRRARGGDDEVDPAMLCDLAVAGLESGAAVPSVLAALGAATGVPELARIGRELVLGASWSTAWDPMPACAPLIADALEPAWCDGASPVPLLERAATQVRARRVADARARAEQLGVRLVVPLGVFLLPAFVALGVVPVLLHLAGGGTAGAV